MKMHIGIAGAGLAGAILARELAETGMYRLSVFEERNHVAGNCHTSRDEQTGIMVHHYSPHIFYTDSEDIWNYMNSWGKFEHFENKIKANTAKGIYPLPVNLMTLNHFFDKKMNPAEARDFLGSIGNPEIKKPQNFEEMALKLVGSDFYYNFIYGFTKKLWGVHPSLLPSSLLKRLPIRFNYQESYYCEKYQGIPVSGYTEIVKRILDHADIELRQNTKLDSSKKNDFDHLFWSAPLDSYFDHCFGRLNYRTLMFERFIDHGDHQGNPIINYCEEEVPYLRISEYKHFTPYESHEKTIFFKEYAKWCEEQDIPYYPVRLNQDLECLKKYVELSQAESRTTFLGRLGTYRYLDMNTVVTESLRLARLCKEQPQTEWPRFSASPL